MGRRTSHETRVAGGERAAYEKLNEALRHGIEAATELSTLQSETGWMAIAIQFQQLLSKVSTHYQVTAARRVRLTN